MNPGRWPVIASTLPTSLPLQRARRWRRARGENGGAGRDRTGDLRLAKAALYQLSYSPGGSAQGGGRSRVVGLSGFEPLTSRLSAVRSSQLSYRPVVPPKASHPSWLNGFPKSALAARRRPGGSLKTRCAQYLKRVRPVDSLERR